MNLLPTSFEFETHNPSFDQNFDIVYLKIMTKKQEEWGLLQHNDNTHTWGWSPKQTSKPHSPPRFKI